MITYDIVSNPSHKTARIMEYLPESDCSDSFDSKTQLVYESSDILLFERDSIKICSNNYEKEFIEKLLEENFNKGLKKVKFSL